MLMTKLKKTIMPSTNESKAWLNVRSRMFKNIYPISPVILKRKTSYLVDIKTIS